VVDPGFANGGARLSATGASIKAPRGYKTFCCSLHAMHGTETANCGKHKPVGK